MGHTTGTFDIGIMSKRQRPPELLQDFSKRAEDAGFDELWLVEDCFFTGALALAASALAYTSTIKVGMGIMPAVARNPAFTAMEIATLARLYPGRFLPGIGHGVADWMRQIGAFPQSQLAALEEVTTMVRALLRGDDVTFQGQHVSLDHVKLVFPPEIIPPISLGVRGPKSLALAGRVADGTILAEYSAPAYVSWSREQIIQGQQAAGRTSDHRLTVYALCYVDSNSKVARNKVRPAIAAALARPRFHRQLEQVGIVPRLREILAAGGQEHLAAAMPDEWIDLLTVAGTPDECAAAVHTLAEAGADSIVLVPATQDNEIMDVIAETLLPLLKT
ncbi:MAG: LLM class flavin-dependent oxidoreductase [Anaerolineae bacterium]|nr:LLM class flavin-dependent oxidoreductase [Anaerolineae bacterium]